ncbi:MAG TPA: DUF5916 domain-containing protein [Gemmatimonadaceae bacterium]|nr:DUF5916 domain-containing protein [Gemmatimonadaceae bacterium]
MPLPPLPGLLAAGAVGALLRSTAVVPPPVAHIPPAAHVPPVAPAGPRTVAATEVPRVSITLDGSLDEPVWRTAPAADGFIQSEPGTGQPATEATEVRVAFDATTLYIGAYLHDREPGRLITNDIKKDFTETDQDDFEVLLDTYLDRHNGYLFLTNVDGAKADRQVSGEGREVNASWDAVWDVRTRRVADGWTVEMAIPFRALRFNPSERATWGVNFSRRIRRKNEIDCWAPIPREYNIMRVSLAGDLEGLRLGASSRDLRVKPYALARSVRAVGVDPYTSTGDAGLDVKVSPTRSLTLDVTVNPDFAQAEADVQTVNLTQFTQFFPEKREFFLENSGIFYVGDAQRTNLVNAPLTPDEDLLLFHSRRIGLTPGGTPITIPAGIRLTGSALGTGIGALAMRTERTDSTPASTYSTVRLRRNLGPGTDVGVFYEGRDGAEPGAGQNHVAGVDENVRFFGKVDWNSYYAASSTPGRTGGEYAWRSSVNYEAKFVHARVAAMELGDGFQDDLAYYRRTGVRKYYLDAGVRQRPSWWQEHGVRELHPHVTWNYYDDLSGATIGKSLHNGQTFFFNAGGYIELVANVHYEFIRDSLRLNRGNPSAQRIAPGGYQWTEWQWIWYSDASRPLSVALTAIGGGLWSGTQRSLNTTLTYHPGYHFRVSAGVQATDAHLDRPDQKFSTTLWTGRANYSFSTKMFLDALTQYDASVHQFNANVRFNVIHHALSDLFVVYNEQRFTTPDAPVPGRSLVVKFTQMLAF